MTDNNNPPPSEDERVALLARSIVRQMITDWHELGLLPADLAVPMFQYGVALLTDAVGEEQVRTYVEAALSGQEFGEDDLAALAALPTTTKPN